MTETVASQALGRAKLIELEGLELGPRELQQVLQAHPALPAEDSSDSSGTDGSLRSGF